MTPSNIEALEKVRDALSAADNVMRIHNWPENRKAVQEALSLIPDLIASAKEPAGMVWDYRDEAINLLQAERDHYRTVLDDISSAAQSASLSNPLEFCEWAFYTAQEAINPTPPKPEQAHE